MGWKRINPNDRAACILHLMHMFKHAPKDSKPWPLTPEICQILTDKVEAMEAELQYLRDKHG